MMPVRPRAAEDDGGLLRLLRETFTAHDPVPASLAARALFAVQLDDVDAELARLVDDMLVPAGARGEESARTVTFSSESLTITITITPQASGRSRIDGWVAPADRLRVELRRQAAASAGCQTDADGRFVLAEVPSGLVQLVFHPAEEADESDAVTVAVPPLQL